MNAPALNPASTPVPGQTGAITGAAPSGQAGGPLAGFDALLAALFPQGVAAGTTPVAASPEAVPTTDAGGQVEITEPVEAIDLEAGFLPGDPNAALLGAGVAGAPIFATSLPAPVETATTEAAAWGRNKPRGVPAAPALANANARAGLTEASEPSYETPPADVLTTAPGAQPQSTQRASHTNSPTTNGSAQALIQAPPAPAAAAARQVATEPPAVDIVAQSVVASEVAQAETTPPATVAGPTPRLEPTPAPPARSARTERTKAASDVKGAGDPQPTQLAGKTATAKAAEGADKTVVAALGVDTPETDDTEIAAEAPDGAQPGETRATAQNLTPAGLAAHAVRGSPETVANLAAQIIKKLEGQSTRFDLELNPGGLGKVDVRLEIGANGQLSAAMTFDNPQAAADLRARAAELQRALEQAGFDLSGGLSFDVAGDRGQQQRQAWQDQTDNNGQAFRGNAFRAALDTAGDAADAAVQGALRLRRGVSAGLDLRI